jgi:two-component system, response regulator
MKTPIILLAQANDGDAELTVSALRQGGVVNEVVRFSTGKDALDYVFAQGAHERRAPDADPVLVLLDVRLRGLSGLDVIAAIRGNPSTRRIPAILLSDAEHEVGRMPLGGSNVVKNVVNRERLVEAAHELGL